MRSSVHDQMTFIPDPESINGPIDIGYFWGFSLDKSRTLRCLNRLKRWILKTIPLTSVPSNIPDWIVKLFLSTWRGNNRPLWATAGSLRTNRYRKSTALPFMKGFSDCCLGDCCSSDVSQLQWGRWCSFHKLLWVKYMIMVLNNYKNKWIHWWLNKRLKKFVMESSMAWGIIFKEEQDFQSERSQRTNMN